MPEDESPTAEFVIERVPIGDVQEDPRNARLHNARNLDAIKASLSRFGQRKPLVLDADGICRAGNGTLAAARALGWDSILVHRSALRGNDAIAYALADNRTGELSEWDDEMLRDLVEDVGNFDAELASALFAEAEVAMLSGDPGEPTPPGGKSSNRKLGHVLPPPRVVNAETKPGDLWTLGGHRLLCGDCTKREDVARLMDGQRADLMFTDPPYGVAYASAKKNAISGDLTQAEIPVGFAVAVDDVLNDDARVYLCGGSLNYSMFVKLFDFYLRSQPRVIVWVKESFVLRPNNYHSQFELVFFGWKGTGGGPQYWFGDRKQSDVWQVARDRDTIHPTQKPVELPARAIGNSCPPGGLVYEPFCGSGSTLIAAENLGRRCFAIEMDPSFCDAIVNRWQQLTGEQATRG